MPTWQIFPILPSPLLPVFHLFLAHHFIRPLSLLINGLGMFPFNPILISLYLALIFHPNLLHITNPKPFSDFVHLMRNP